MQKRSAVLLERVGLKLDPKTLVRNLAVAEQQMVEIAKGLSADADVFIFDEPTAALNSADVARLESLIRGLRDAGKAIIYISHRLNEIFGMCDTVTVLKDGRHIKTCPTAELDEHALVALMVGRELFEFFPPRSGKVGTQALVVEGLQTKDSGPRVNFALQRGEILGLAGLEGQGQREIARAVVGLTPLLAGEIRKFNLKDKQTIRLAPEAGIGKVIQQGVAFIPEDRKSEGLFLDLSIGENIALGTEVGKGLGTIAPNAKKIVSELMRAMKIGTGNSKAEVKSLSGGNQQKVLIGRWLASGVDILVIEEPTRGVDVGAKAEIYRLLREFTEKGGAVLVLSREAPELIGLCDRILIVHGQQIVDDLPATEATEHRILHSALKTKDAAAQVAA
jgi:ribose transport system ATP-binding protein